MDNTNLVLDLSSLHKTKVTIKNGDDLRDLYLNLSDMNIIVRFKEKYDELQNLEKDAFESIDTNDVLATADKLKEVDAKMREIVDYIFDSNVCEVCVPFGSMYDLVGGKMRYEHIIDAISGLYESNIHEETKKLEKRLNKHTQKYTKK